MKIVIAGAGDIGFYLAKLLSFEKQDIILIDTNQGVLDYAHSHLDVLTLKGDSSSIEILKLASAGKADLFLAVTTHETTNLISAILAKKMGARRTIARVDNLEYLSEAAKTTFEELGVDKIISLRHLAAQEIARLVQQCSLTDIFDFEKGKLSVIGFTLDDASPLINRTILEIDQKDPHVLFRPIAILRGQKTIIPHGDTVLRKNDHIYCITKNERIEKVVQFVGKELIKVKNVMIIGGNELSLKTAQILENEYNVTLVEKQKETCKMLAEKLHRTLVIEGDPGNMELLKEEGLANMDIFIALTPNSETNIISSLMADEYGVYKTIALVDNMDYTHISQNIGVDTLINKKLIAANNIFRFVRKGKIEAITSLHGVDAEIIEFVIHKNNKATRHPIKDLHFPKTAIIGGVIRGEETIIPNGDFQLQVEDKVIVLAQSEAIGLVEKLFR